MGLNDQNQGAAAADARGHVSLVPPGEADAAAGAAAGGSRGPPDVEAASPRELDVGAVAPWEEDPGCVAAASSPQGASECGGREVVPRQPLSAAEATALGELQAQLDSRSVASIQDALVPGESLETCLLRFLKAQHLKVAATVRALQADIAWRKAVEPRALAGLRPDEILGCDAHLIQKYMPVWHQGFDRSGRPVIFAQYGRFRFPPVIKHTSVDKLLRLHVHNSERSALLCGQQTSALQLPVTSVVTVVDAEGWDPHNLLVKASYTWAKGMAEIDQDHYPERLGEMLIINAPSVVYRFWSAVQYFLPEQTRRRVRLFAQRAQWLPELLRLVDEAQLPPEYGGSAVSGAAGGP